MINNPEIGRSFIITPINPILSPGSLQKRIKENQTLSKSYMTTIGDSAVGPDPREKEVSR